MDEWNSSAAMMGIPSKPKFVLSNPALSRRQSHTMLKTKRDKQSPESQLRDSVSGDPQSPSKTKKNRSGLDTVLHSISDFSHDANEHYNIKYQDFEKSMSDMLDQFQTQIEQFQAARANAEQMIKAFEQQVDSTHETYDTDLEQLREWQAPAEKIEHMQARVAELRTLLASKKERLAWIDKELTEAEDQHQQEHQQQRRSSGSLIVAAIIIIPLAYYLFRR